MDYLLAAAFVLAFLGLAGLGVFLAVSNKLRTTENSLFENLDEEHMYSRKAHCDEYSAGVFHW